MVIGRSQSYLLDIPRFNNSVHLYCDKVLLGCISFVRGCFITINEYVVLGGGWDVVCRCLSR